MLTLPINTCEALRSDGASRRASAAVAVVSPGAEGGTPVPRERCDPLLGLAFYSAACRQ